MLSNEYDVALCTMLGCIHKLQNLIVNLLYVFLSLKGEVLW